MGKIRSKVKVKVATRPNMAKKAEAYASTALRQILSSARSVET